jgi:hypothetical protein
MSLSHIKRLRIYSSGQNACGQCQKYRVECVPQPNPKKTALACNNCTLRKLKCIPLAAWAQALQDARQAKPKKRSVVGAFSFPIQPHPHPPYLSTPQMPWMRAWQHPGWTPKQGTGNSTMRYSTWMPCCVCSAIRMVSPSLNSVSVPLPFHCLITLLLAPLPCPRQVLPLHHLPPTSTLCACPLQAPRARACHPIHHRLMVRHHALWHINLCVTN